MKPKMRQECRVWWENHDRMCDLAHGNCGMVQCSLTLSRLSPNRSSRELAISIVCHCNVSSIGVFSPILNAMWIPLGSFTPSWTSIFDIFLDQRNDKITTWNCWRTSSSLQLTVQTRLHGGAGPACFSNEVPSFGFWCWTYAVLGFSQSLFVLPITMMLQDGRAPLWRGFGDSQGHSHFNTYEMFAW